MSDETTIKQYPFDLKAEATAAGYRIHGHVYSDSMDDAVTPLISEPAIGADGSLVFTTLCLFISSS